MPRPYPDQALTLLRQQADSVEVNGSTVHVRASVPDLAPGALDPWLVRREELNRERPSSLPRPGLRLLLSLAFRPEAALVRMRDMAEGVVLSPGDEGGLDLASDAGAVAVTSEELVLWRNGVRLWKYKPTATSATPRPAFLHVHGGGWFAGRPTGRDYFLKYLAARSGAVIFDLDYSLSPEHKFPHALYETHAAIRHLHEGAAAYGIDPRRIAVGGGSAGANLTAAATLKARADGGPQIALQVLMNPIVLLGRGVPSGLRWRDSDFVVAEPARKSVGRITDPAKSRKLRLMTRPYVGTADADDPLLSPALARDLSGLPPALIFTAEMDNLRPQGEHYAGQLAQAGVPVRTVRYRGIKHDSPAYFGYVPQAEAMALEVVTALQDLLIPETPETA